MFLDSWSGHKDQKIFDENLGENIFEICIIPPKTTPIAQPLDVYFNYWWKYFARRIADCVAIDRIDINLSDRNNIIKMHSLIHWQLGSEVYKPMIKYAWHKAGYLNEHPGPFQSVADFAFPKKNHYCDIINCQKISFIQCSRCINYLCFQHFFIDYHYNCQLDVWVEI